MPAKNELQMDQGRYEYFLHKYKGQIKSEILKQYKDPDEYVVLNEDKHLHPIHIKLPEPPEWHTIDGWGLAAKDQKFTYQKFPKKLQKIVESCQTVDDVWNRLELEQREYRKEIEWIKSQWRRYENGYWFFCNGKPTYLVGWHYIYLNFWHFKSGGKPEYRDRNRKFYHALYYAYTTKQTVAVDPAGKLVYENADLRILQMVETSFRTMYGVQYPKPRKDGASNMCLCAEYMEVITHKGVVGGIVSMTGDHAQIKLFDEIMVPGWNNMPFFFKPKTTSNKNPGAEISFSASRARADKLENNELGCTINYSTTSSAAMYDGGNNIWINRDEAGKSKDSDVYIDHSQLKPCVALGNGSEIFGILTYPSTVGEMEGAGGKNYYNIAKESQFEKRNISGQTQSGLMVIYMSAAEGLTGFVGPYGESIIDDPTPEQAEFIGRDYGAKKFLMEQRAAKLAAGNLEGYNEEVRLFPLYYMECFRTSDGDIGFNSQVINDRLDELAFIWKENVRQGNFHRYKGELNGKVYWEDDPNGKFFLSKLLNEDQTNRFYTRNIGGADVRFPFNPKFTASADPFKFDETQGNRMSDAGGAVFWDHDPEIDPPDKDIKYFKSHRFVCTYLYRTAKKKEMGEDLLMMCEYFGAWMFPEIDFPYIWDYFNERGRGGYLKHEIDRKTEKAKNTPGFNAKGRKQDIFNVWRDYIQDHGHREFHKDILMQCKDIENMDQMTDYDLITAGGGCLLATPGIKNSVVPLNAIPEKNFIQSVIPMRDYTKYMR